MATFKSDLVTNRDSNPNVLNSAGVSSAERRIMVAKVAVTDAVEAGDDLILFALPAAARLHSLYLWSRPVWTTNTAPNAVTSYSRTGQGTYTKLQPASYHTNKEVPSWDETLDVWVNFAYRGTDTDDGASGRPPTVMGRRLWEDALFAKQSDAPSEIFIGFVPGAVGVTSTLMAEAVYTLD